MLGEAVVIDPKKARVHRLRSSIREACKLHEQEADYAARKLGRSAYRKTFITLTYRPGVEWSRRHISDFLKHLRRWMQAKDAGLMYAWVAELQQRGALHYHLIVWVPRRLRLPRPDSSGWWPHGMSNLETARNPVGYMVKYATKTRPEDLKRLKKGVRLHGNGGHNPANRTKLRETLSPWWIRQTWQARQDGKLIEAHEAAQPFDPARWPPRGSPAYWERLLADAEAYEAETRLWERYADTYEAQGWPKYRRVTGGFVDLLTGELIPTPWRVTVEGGTVTAHRLETLQ